MTFAISLPLSLMLAPMTIASVAAQQSAPASVVVPTDRTVLPIPEPQYPHSTVFDVRNATPPGASGRVYGFVYSGLDLGATLSPVAMGLLLDHGSARVVFAAIGCFLFVAIATVVQVRRSVSIGAHRLHGAD